MMTKSTSAISLVITLIPITLCANPPKLDNLFPAGAKRSSTTEITAGGAFKNWPVLAWTSNPGVTFKPAKKQGKFTVAIAKNALPGVCWIRLYDKYGASDLRPFIIGNLKEIAEREPNDKPGKAQILQSNSVTLNGKLQRTGDVDVYALDLRKGQTLVASMEAYHTLRSPMDGILQILSPKGFVLAQNDDYHGKDPQIVFSVPSDGRYFVRTFAFPETPTSSIRFAGANTFIYRLTLTTGGFVDHAVPLAVSRSSPGRVNLIGWNIESKASAVPVTVIPGSDTGIAFDSNFAKTARVRLERHAVLVENKKHKRNKPQAVQAPITITGQIATVGEEDIYEVALKKGQRLDFEIDASSIGSPLDPVLLVTNPDGKILKQMFSRKIDSDPVLKYSASSAATYRIGVRDLHHRGGERFVYRLRLTKPQPDFAVKITKDRFVLTPGKSLEMPITIERKNGFNKKIDIVAQGLPDGITAKTIQADSKAKSIKLRLAGKGKIAFGSFRILGRAQGNANQLRLAQAPLSEFSTSTADLWITMSNDAKPDKKKK